MDAAEETGIGSLSLERKDFRTSSRFGNLIPELLAEIFLLAKAELNAQDWHNVHSFVGNQAPLNISRVCKNWRIVALSVASLWSDIYATRKNSGGGRFWRTQVAIGTWLERSRTALLDIRITRAITETLTQMQAKSLLNLLFKSSSRWKRFQVLFYHVGVARSITAFTFSDLTQCEYFDFGAFYSNSSPSIPNDPVLCVIDASNCPRLNSLSLVGPLVARTDGTILEHLTSIHLETVRRRTCPIEDYITIISIAPRLTTLYVSFPVDVITTFDAEPLDDSHLTLFNLCELTIRFFKEKESAGLFLMERLTVPALRNFELEYRDYGSWNEDDANIGFVTSFLRRSYPPLSTLSIKRPRSNGTSLVETLRIVPGLNTLSLHGFIVTGDLISALTLKLHATGPHAICAGLQAIKFTECEMNGPLPAMVLSRWNSNSDGSPEAEKNFTRIELRDCLGRCISNPSLSQVLELCMSEGLDVDAPNLEIRERG